MRIAYYADNFYPELSGIVDSILLTGRTLKKRGHEVMYVGPRYSRKNYATAKCSPDGLTASGLAQAGECDELGVDIVRMPSLPLPFSPTGQSRLALPFGSTFNAVRKFKPDIIHTSSPYGAGIEAMRAAKKLGVPLIGTNHTVIEEYYPFAPELMRRYEAWYYNHCSFVSAPYAALIARMREKGFLRNGGAVPNPVELSTFCPPKADEKSALRREKGHAGPVILYAGRLAGEKRIDVVLRAVALVAKRIPNLSFVIVGSGSADGALKSLARELGIEKNVRFTGFLSHEAMSREFCAADIFAIMSTSDSQSLTLMQAYSSGLPAVGARSHGLIDYMPPECGILVPPGDAGACAQALEKLILDVPLRERMGKAAVEFVAQFAPENIAARWEEIYKQALTRRPSAI